MARNQVLILGGGTLVAGAAVALWLALSAREDPAPLTAGAPTSAPTLVPPPANQPVAPQEQAAAPSFDVVRLSVEGDALVAGRASPGAAITLRVDGSVVAQAAADGAGQFVALFSLGFSDTMQVMTLEMADARGAVVEAPDTVILTPRPAPAAPVVIAQIDALAPVEVTTVNEVARPSDATLVADPVTQLAVAPTETVTSAPVDAQAGVEPATQLAVAPTEAVTSAPVDAQAGVEPATQLAMAPTEAVTSAPVDAQAGVEPATQLAMAPTEAVTSAPVDAQAGIEPATQLAVVSPTSETPAVAETQGQVAAAPAGEAIPMVPSAAAPVAVADAVPAVVIPAPTPEPVPTLAAGEQTEPPPVEIASAATAVAGQEGASALETARMAEAPSTAVATVPSIDSAGTTATAILMRQDGRVEVLDRAPRVMDNVVIDAISYSETGDVQISGRAAGSDPSSRLRVYLDNRPIALALAEQGDWELDLPSIDAGIYTLRVDQLNPEGGVVSRFETPFLRESAESLAAVRARTQPAQPAGVEPPGATLSGPVQADAPTTDAPVEHLAADRGEPESRATADASPALVSPPVPDGPVAPSPSPSVSLDAPTAPPVSAPAVPVSASAPAAGSGPVSPDPATRTQAVQAPRPRAALITVQPGHTLWAISRDTYGHGDRFMIIFNANRSQIRNPDLIYPGQVFALPGN